MIERQAAVRRLCRLWLCRLWPAESPLRFIHRTKLTCFVTKDSSVVFCRAAQIVMTPARLT